MIYQYSIELTEGLQTQLCIQWSDGGVSFSPGLLNLLVPMTPLRYDKVVMNMV